MEIDEALQQEAELLAKYLTDIRAILKRTQDTEIAAAGLTLPQVDVLRELTNANGLSLKELSKRLGLVHSTVSGIVDRLEQRGFVQRRADPDDKRFTRIYASQNVMEYADRTMYSWRGNVIAKALQQATPAEREQIVKGIAKLYDLLAGEADQK
jgi:DNA-binding MarR family transcriptional regulator